MKVLASFPIEDGGEYAYSVRVVELPGKALPFVVIPAAPGSGTARYQVAADAMRFALDLAGWANVADSPITNGVDQ